MKRCGRVLGRLCGFVRTGMALVGPPTTTGMLPMNRTQSVARVPELDIPPLSRTSK
jgi:hypothetical protein